jgi:glycosyltransferase involved in cell wall biosynthesis
MRPSFLLPLTPDHRHDRSQQASFPSLHPAATSAIRWSRPMRGRRIWIVATGEPLPTDVGPPRLLRKGMIATRLAQRGHEVTWFTSAFNHQRKIMRPASSTDVDAGSARMKLITLPALGYERHVSMARLRDHRTTAAGFRMLASGLPQPDVICASLPTIELAVASTSHALEVGARSVVDVRDLWPDIFYERVPRVLRPLARAPLAPLERAADRACREATAIVGISDAFLDWGLRRAGRERTGADRVFPLAYERPRSHAPAVAEASAFWNSCGATSDRTILSFIGSLTEVFDFGHIVQAARQPENAGLLFVIAGDGPLRRHLEATAPDNVLLPGWVDAQQAMELLRRSTAALAPYVPRHDFEGTYSNKVIEYLGSGLPILTTLAMGETARLLREESIGVSYDRTASGLTAAIARVVAEGRHEIGNRASDVFEHRFLADKVYGEYCDLLEELAN